MKTWGELGIVIPPVGGIELDTTCPKCSATRKNRKAKCLSVNTAKGTFFCHHCGWAGGLEHGERNEEPSWRKPVHRVPPPLLGTQDEFVADFLDRRGITRDVIERNGIVAARVYMPQVESHVTAIAFPYRRNGVLVNVKYRDLAKNFRMEAGAERMLYGRDDIQPDRCVIVEGEIDKLSCEVAGITSCVSVPDGAPTPNAKDYASKFTFLENDADRATLEGVAQWVLAVDADAPGRRLEDELVRRLGADRCRRVVWPEGVKDANDMLRQHGPDALRAAIDAAEPIPLSGVFSADDLAREIDMLYEQGVQSGVSTGWPSLDGLYTVRPGEMTVITGVPNSGKSNWMDALSVNLARSHGWRFAIFSPENQPLANHISRLMEHHSGVPFRHGPTARLTPAQVADEREWVSAHFRFLLPDDESQWTVDWIITTATALVQRFGITGLVIDPWNELEQQRPERQTETEYISDCLRKLRQFARRNRVHLFVVAHPTKMYRGKDGKYPVPSLYDISGSAHWRNKADNGIVIFRDLNEPERPGVEIHVQKVRFREVGKIGGCELRYDRVTGGYTEWIRQKEPPARPTSDTATEGTTERNWWDV